MLGAADVAAGASADQASVTIDNLEPKLTEAEDKSWTAKLGFTNLTSADIALVVRAAEPKAGCVPTLDKPSVTAASHADVKLTLPTGCKADDQARVGFIVAAQAPATERFSIFAKPDKKAKSDWNHLLAFPIALILALFGLLVTYKTWTPPDPSEPSGDTPTEPAEKPALEGDLPYLDKTYDFKESLVSNVTALGAVLTGVFASSDVIEAALGEDAKTEIGLATVGAAIALGLIAAGTIVPLAAKGRDAKSYTVWGILLGASVTLAGAAGQLWVMAWTGEELDLGMAASAALWISFILAIWLLGGYGRTALVATLNQGITPPKEEPSEALAAAWVIVAGLRPKEELQRLEDEWWRYPSHGTSPGDELFPRRRAATL